MYNKLHISFDTEKSEKDGWCENIYGNNPEKWDTKDQSVAVQRNMLIIQMQEKRKEKVIK